MFGLVYACLSPKNILIIKQLLVSNYTSWLFDHLWTSTEGRGKPMAAYVCTAPSQLLCFGDKVHFVILNGLNHSILSVRLQIIILSEFSQLIII